MPGKDADIVVFDTDQTWTLTADMLYSKCGWSLYTGETMLANERVGFDHRQTFLSAR